MADLTAGGVPVYRDSVGVLRETKGQGQIDALAVTVAGKADASALAGKADVSALPQPATATPKSEMTGGNTGAAATRYALEDHQHPRLTSTTYATLNASGQATVTFTRAFTNKPGLNITETDAAAGSQPLVVRGLSWVQNSQNAYTGVVIQGSRAQLLPTLNPLAGTLALLTAVITGVNTLFAQLSGYNLFGGSASGATVSVIAVARSDVAAT